MKRAAFQEGRKGAEGDRDRDREGRRGARVRGNLQVPHSRLDLLLQGLEAMLFEL